MISSTIRILRMPAVLAAALLVGIVGAPSAQAQAVQRPITDFLGPNIAAGGIYWFETGQSTWAFFDYFGRTALLNNLSLGSSFEGKVVERARSDGKADVHVVLRSRGVLSWAVDSSAGQALIFGHTGPQVKAGADPALADTLLTVEFVNSAPGAPLPSLFALSFVPSPNYQLDKMLLEASADGTLRAAYGVADGTPGRLHTTQRGLPGVPGIQVGQDNGFPAEKVTLQVVGD